MFVFSTISCHKTIFAALDTDYINDIHDHVAGPKSLSESCMDTILSDWCITRCLEGRIPNVLIFKLIDRALENDRILSARFLLERYPLEEFVFPIPDYMRLCNVVTQQRLPFPITNWIKNMHDKLNIVIASFKNVVLEDHAKSKLQILNFNKLPHPLTILGNICEIFEENSSYSQKYVVKGSFMFMQNEDYVNFVKYHDKLAPNLNLILTGLFCLNIPANNNLTNVFDRVNDQDMQYLAMHFVTSNLAKHLPYVQRFKNLTMLSLTYVRGLQGNCLNHLAQIIYELPELQKLGFKSSKITNHLQSLLMKNCKMRNPPQAKKRKTEDDSSCCAIHRGKLQFLDVSSCSLVDSDLECLKEYPFCANLKHLAIGSNMLTTERLTDCLEHMASNLVILDLYSSFKEESNLESFINILDKFKMLNIYIRKFFSTQTVKTLTV